ncbi:MAG: hypothetical protein CVT74_15600 [Alphaproteobacteria bacterium HGW-Alphaproteobacteria-13]|nr:MAG: hypothetical protein CVT74_15600 [Alphaproteobacteria bacterium HGW-Alphaproteobacteria-13]
MGAGHLLQGCDWASDAFAASLSFDLEPVVDPARPLLVRVRGAWSQPAPAGATIHLRLAAFADGKPIGEFGRHVLSNGDLVARPQRILVAPGAIASGTYRLEGTIESNGQAIGVIRAPVSFVAGWDGRQAEIEGALARIAGHDNAKATIRYPFSLARELFEGTREVRSFDFAAGVARSRSILAALEAGSDPLVRAKGDIRRAYHMPEADTIVTFRLFVPSTWDGRKKLPLMIFLHGANLDDDDSMERADGLLPRLAEERGVILLAPLGYRMNSMYGAPVPTRFATAGSPIAGIDAKRRELSERDVLNLADMIAREYGVDPDRIYLSGNSMGAMGTWHLAQKYPERWAAIAPAAAGATDDHYDFARLRGMPIMPVAGEHDFLRPMVEDTVARARAAGLKPQYLMVPGGDHGTGVEMAMPKIFDFFLKHKRARRIRP